MASSFRDYTEIQDQKSSGSQRKDHGWAWLVAISTHLCRILHDGISKAMGVMLPALSAEFEIQIWKVGLAVSLMSVIGGSVAVIAGPMTKLLQPRRVIMVNGVLICLGFILCSYAINWTMFAVILIVITGIPLRVSWFIMLSMLGEYFEENYAIANSIAYAGSSTAVVIFAPLTQLLLNVYGWRGTIFILASISLHVSLCGAVLKLRNRTKDPCCENFDPDECTDESNCDSHESAKHFLARIISDIFEVQLFRQPIFLATLSIEFSLQYSWTGWVIYLVPYARSIGFSPYLASLVASAGGVGAFVGTLAIAVILKSSLDVKHVMISILLVAGFSLVLYPLTETIIGLLVLSFVFGMAENAGLVAILSLGKSLNGELSQVIAWIFFASSMGRLSSGFFTGWIYDQTNSYDLSFVVLGSVLLSAAIILGSVSLMSRQNPRTFKREST